MQLSAPSVPSASDLGVIILQLAFEARALTACFITRGIRHFRKLGDATSRGSVNCSINKEIEYSESNTAVSCTQHYLAFLSGSQACVKNEPCLRRQ